MYLYVISENIITDGKGIADSYVVSDNIDIGYGEKSLFGSLDFCINSLPRKPRTFWAFF